MWRWRRSCAASKLPALFRVHAAPDEKKLDQLRATLRVLGIELQLPEPVHAARSGSDRAARARCRELRRSSNR